jgi:FlaG/FlaF family flagellin (archaellin)
MAMVSLLIASLSIVSITIILAASILSVALTEFANFRIVQGLHRNLQIQYQQQIQQQE